MKVTRLFDILPHVLESYPDQEFILAGKVNKKWKKYNIAEYIQNANNISYGLMKLGIKAGDKVGLISGSRPEWNFVDMGTMQCGAVIVPIYPTISEKDYRYILNHADITVLIVEGQALKSKIEPLLKDLPNIKYLYTIVEVAGVEPLSNLIELGANNPAPEDLEVIKAKIDKMDLATMIYTSGTTGNPKGVMLSHNNIVQNFYNLRDIPAKWSKTALSFLPLCHSYERMLVYLYQYLGMSIYYAESLATIAENIKETNTTMMTCVPRLLEKIYDKLYLKGKSLSFAQRVIYNWAFNLASRYQLEGMSWWYNLQAKLADKLIYSKWREGIGGNFDIVVSGGSALQSHMASFFSAIGMPVFEGYGLSETSPVIAVSNRSEHGRKFGTVGQKMPGTELKIGDKNEILTRGHNVMMGYYKDPELTSQVIDADGWLHTGDTGILDENGVLKITGRLKNLFKTSFGKYVNPDVMDAEFTKSPFIEFIVILGENEKFVSALINPDYLYLKEWAAKHNITYSTNADLAVNPKVVARIQEEVKKYNKLFGDWEQIKRFEIVSDVWDMSNYLTPTLKVKRKEIEKDYAERIAKLFQ